MRPTRSTYFGSRTVSTSKHNGSGQPRTKPYNNSYNHMANDRANNHDDVTNCAHNSESWQLASNNRSHEPTYPHNNAPKQTQTPHFAPAHKQGTATKTTMNPMHYTKAELPHPQTNAPQQSQPTPTAQILYKVWQQPAKTYDYCADDTIQDILLHI